LLVAGNITCKGFELLFMLVSTGITIHASLNRYGSSYYRRGVKADPPPSLRPSAPPRPPLAFSSTPVHGRPAARPQPRPSACTHVRRLQPPPRRQPGSIARKPGATQIRRLHARPPPPRPSATPPGTGTLSPLLSLVLTLFSPLLCLFALLLLDCCGLLCCSLY